MAEREAELAAADTLMRSMGFVPVAWQHPDGTWVGDYAPPPNPIAFSISAPDPSVLEEQVSTAAEIADAVARARSGTGPQTVLGRSKLRTL